MEFCWTHAHKIGQQSNSFFHERIKNKMVDHIYSKTKYFFCFVLFWWLAIQMFENKHGSEQTFEEFYTHSVGENQKRVKSTFGLNKC